MTKNTAELSKLLMQHSYFLEEPGKSMTRQQISTILNAHIQRKGAYHVDRAELERAIRILLSDEYQYADPISIMQSTQTFSFGICQLEDTGFKKKTERKQHPSPGQQAQQRLQVWEREHDHKWATDPVFRQDVIDTRKKYGAARWNEMTREWEIYDELYHKCWCHIINGRLSPLNGEISYASQPEWQK